MWWIGVLRPRANKRKQRFHLYYLRCDYRPSWKKDPDECMWFKEKDACKKMIRTCISSGKCPGLILFPEQEYVANSSEKEEKE